MSPHGTDPRTGRTARIFAGLVLVAGAVLLAGAGIRVEDPRLWFWLVACALSEMLWTRLPLGGATLSMGSTANFAALLLLPSGVALPATAFGCLGAELAVMRKPWLRAAFNAASTVLAVGAASALAHRLAPLGVFTQHGGRLALTVGAAAAVYYLCNRALVVTVLVLAGSGSPRAVWQRNFGVRADLAPTGAALSLGVLLAQLHQQTGVVAVLFVLLPGWIVFDAHRRSLAARGPATLTALPRETPARSRAANE